MNNNKRPYGYKKLIDVISKINEAMVLRDITEL